MAQHNLKLPKGYLSFSQIDLWLRSPETYRKKYYAGVKYGTTPAMEFGNKVTLAMEKNEDWVSFIPRHDTFERELTVDFDGIPVLMFIDNMDTKINKFREQKTGKTPWTQNKVNKHLQLDIYSTGLEIHDGFVCDECDLVWVETEHVEVTQEYEFKGIKMGGAKKEIRLTGNYKVFPRTITKEDRQRCKELVVRVGREIEEDYAAYKHLYV